MQEVTFKLDFRLLSLLLLVIIGVMLAFWRPWQGISKQTITVSGSATVKAAPDQFTFSPVYQGEAKTSTEAISAASKTGNSVVAKLKELGVADKDLKTSVNSNPTYDLKNGTQSGSITAQYSITASVYDKDLAQKVVDYLTTTSPLYGVTPQSMFKTETSKTLEGQARVKAIEDARTKAEQTATALGMKVGRVVNVSEPQWGGPILPANVMSKEAQIDSSASTSPTLLIGEQDVTFSVQVIFALR